MFLAHATIQYFIMVISLNTFSRLSFIHGTGNYIYWKIQKLDLCPFVGNPAH